MDKDIEREHQYTMSMAQNNSDGIVILKLSKSKYNLFLFLL